MPSYAPQSHGRPPAPAIVTVTDDAPPEPIPRIGAGPPFLPVDEALCLTILFDRSIHVLTLFLAWLPRRKTSLTPIDSKEGLT
jgi:hypothetical protein